VTTAGSAGAGEVSLRKDRPFSKLLVANRGEIALRIFRACREMGVATVAVYSDADADALHAKAADEALRIGGAAAPESYLRVDAIIDAARSTGAQAVHPGYGFLSEQPALAEACEAAGLVFVGPSPRILTELGNKLAAREAAAAVGVPVVPGTLQALPEDASAAQLDAATDGVGYPLLVKAAAGGGGRGMRRVEEPAELAASVAAAAKEARAAFGDGSVYLERYVERARHVEVQLIGDVNGNVVAVGERDCSTQRRHQKLVEEAPAPGLLPVQRRTLHALAVDVARAVGLLNAATAEFLLTPDGEFWFLEVNARLQVEHGVTELVSGLDLVHEQLRLAAGRGLSAEARAAADRAHQPFGHAIEVRISAEDPAHDFAPSPGVVDRWQPPAGPGVRVDSGVSAGSAVSTYYDPLLAKLMVHAPSRPAAIARLRRALGEFVVGGVQTTLPFHRWLVDQPDFSEATGLSTDYVARAWAPAPIAAEAALRAARAVAQAWRPPGPTGGRQPASAIARPWWEEGIRERLADGER
jgi:acetyl/propionyl-CoA carboxylase alpha subunit